MFSGDTSAQNVYATLREPPQLIPDNAANMAKTNGLDANDVATMETNIAIDDSIATFFRPALVNKEFSLHWTNYC